MFERAGTKNTGTEVARSAASVLCRLSRVMMSALQPRISAARSLTSISWNSPKRALLVIEKQIDIGFLMRLATRGRAEQ